MRRSEFTQHVISDWSRIFGHDDLADLDGAQALIWSGRLVHRLLDRNVREFGFGRRIDYDVAALVHRREPTAPTAQDVAEMLLISPSSLTRVLDRLEARGLLERHSDPHNGRVIRLHLSPSGRSAVKMAVEANLRLYRKFFDQLSSRERVEFQEMTKRVLDRLDSLTSSPDS